MVAMVIAIMASTAFAQFGRKAQTPSSVAGDFL
jgi:hypothetical protein